MCASKPSKTWAGLKHQRHLLNYVLVEAYKLGRTAVLHDMLIAAMHNFGKRQRRPFSDIFDMECSRIWQAGMPADFERPDWIEGKDFDFGAFSSEQIKTIGRDDKHFISEEDDSRYALIIRDTSTMHEDKWGGADNYTNLPGIHISIAPTARIHAMASDIIDEITGGLPPRENTDFLPRYDFIDGQWRMPPGAYACAHVRLGDRPTFERLWRFAVHPDKFFEMAKRFLPVPGAPLYVMSNMEDTEYHAKLKEMYRVFTARDFPQLRNYLPPAGHIVSDEYLLYREIEQKDFLFDGWDSKNRSLRARKSPLAGPEDPDNTIIYAVEELIHMSAYVKMNTDYLNSFQFSLEKLYAPHPHLKRSVAAAQRGHHHTAVETAPFKSTPRPKSRNAKTETARYLLHEYGDSEGGVMRHRRRLEALLCEAALLGRVAVIDQWNMDPRYNRGQMQRRSSADFVDLDDARVYGHGLPKQGIAVPWIMKDQLDLNAIDAKQRKTVGIDEGVDTESKLVVRHFKGHEEERRAIPPPCLARLPATKHIQALADDVCYQIGHCAPPQIRNALEIRHWSGIRNGAGTYVCLQLPILDSDASIIAKWRYANQISQKNILKKLKKILTLWKNDQSLRLYVMSERPLTKRWHKIGNYAAVYTAYDFRNLRPYLESDNGTCDLFTVFAVEALIMQNAKVKIFASAMHSKEVAVTDPQHLARYPSYPFRINKGMRFLLRVHRKLRRLL